MPKRSDLKATEVIVVGTLLDDAEWRVTTGGNPAGLVRLTIDQGPALPLVRAWQCVGTNATAMMAAQTKCRLLKRGLRVKVYGEGLHVPNSGVIEISGVNQIVPLDIPAAHALALRSAA